MPSPTPHDAHGHLDDLLLRARGGELDAAGADALMDLIEGCAQCHALFEIESAFLLAPQSVGGGCPALSELEHMRHCPRCQAMLASLAATPPASARVVPFFPQARIARYALVAVLLLLVAGLTVVLPRSQPAVERVTLADLLIPPANAQDQTLLTEQTIALLQTQVDPMRPYEAPLIDDLDGDGAEEIYLVSGSRILGYPLANLRADPIFDQDATALLGESGGRQRRDYDTYRDWVLRERGRIEKKNYEINRRKELGSNYLADLVNDQRIWKNRVLPQLLASGDRDGDGDRELLLRIGRSLVFLNAAGAVEAYWGPAGKPTWPPFETLFRMADLDHDGAEEILMAGGAPILFPQGYVDPPATLLDGAPLDFRGLVVLDGRTGDVRWQLPLPNPRDLAVGDMNGDGDPDLTLFNWPAGNGYAPIYDPTHPDPLIKGVDLASFHARGIAGASDADRHVLVLSAAADGRLGLLYWHSYDIYTPEYNPDDRAIAEDHWYIPPPGTGVRGLMSLGLADHGADDPLRAYRLRVFQPNFDPSQSARLQPMPDSLEGIVQAPGTVPAEATWARLAGSPSLLLGVGPAGAVLQLDPTGGKVLARASLPNPTRGLRQAAVLASGDLDGDQRPEIVATSREFFGWGGGSLVTILNDQLQPVAWQSKLDLSSNSLVRAARIGDVDGDGTSELVLLGAEIQVVYPGRL